MTDILDRLAMLPILPATVIHAEAKAICREAIREIELLRERESLRDTFPPRRTAGRPKAKGSIDVV